MSQSHLSSAPLGLGIFGQTVTSASVSHQFTGFLFSCNLVSRLCTLEAGSMERVERPRVQLSSHRGVDCSHFSIINYNHSCTLLLVLWSHCRLFVNTLFLCTHSGHSILSSRCGGGKSPEGIRKNADTFLRFPGTHACPAWNCKRTQPSVLAGRLLPWTTHQRTSGEEIERQLWAQQDPVLMCESAPWPLTQLSFSSASSQILTLDAYLFQSIPLRK